MHSKQWKLHRAVLCLLVATVVGMVLGGVARTETAAALAVQDIPHANPGQPAGQEPEAESAEHEAGHADPFTIILLELAALILAAVFGRWAAGLRNAGGRGAGLAGCEG